MENLAYLIPPGNNDFFDKINGLLDLFAHKVKAAVVAVSKRGNKNYYYYSSFVVLDVIFNVFNNEKYSSKRV